MDIMSRIFLYCLLPALALAGCAKAPDDGDAVIATVSSQPITLKQFNAMAGEQIQLSTQPLATAAWSEWLTGIEAQGIRIVRCRISSTAQPGMASLELTLQGGQP